MSEQTTTCVIVGGGPAGMVAGLLLARGGVQVTVLERHADFLRIMPCAMTTRWCGRAPRWLAVSSRSEAAARAVGRGL